MVAQNNNRKLHWPITPRVRIQKDDGSTKPQPPTKAPMAPSVEPTEDLRYQHHVTYSCFHH